MADVEVAQLADVLGEVARSLESEHGVADTLAGIVRAAIVTVPGAEQGAVSLIEGRHRVTSTAASGPVAKRCDALPSQTGQGPCLQAIAAHQTVVVADLAVERRWPLFCAGAAALGARSMLSVQLFVHDDDLGALNLYSSVPEAFTAESEQVGLLFAAHAAVALIGAQHERQLTQAVASRELIGQTQGLLMAQNTIGADAAFALLVAASQRSNTKLRELVDQIVADAEQRAAGRTARAPKIHPAPRPAAGPATG